MACCGIPLGKRTVTVLSRRRRRQRASALKGADVVGRAFRPWDAVEVDQRHAAAHGSGTAGGARIDRYGAALEMVIPGHIAGVVHEERAPLSGGQGDRARLGPAAAEIPV